MNTWPDELRLAWVVVLTALVFASSLRFTRKVVGGDWVESLLDALLLTFVIQYLAVCLPGLAGVLNVWSIAVTAVLGCGALNAASRERWPGSTTAGADPAQPPQRAVDWVAVALTLFVVCYVSVAVWEQRILPPFANDPLTYHLPAAVEWVQLQRLTLYETWFYNPANTYSPLAGSALAAWWLAPMANDVLARFVQAPAVLLLFVAMVQVVRAFGLQTGVAALVATGAVCSRPFISQAILAKDDLFLAALFAASVAALTRIKLSDPFGPWRLGLALGMLLATKYTALLSLPLLFLAIDAPVRAGWRWRDWGIAAGVTLLLAGPWYLRNLLLTGNPLFPINLPLVDGLFATRRSPQLASWEGLWKSLIAASSYYTTTVPVAVVLVAGWLAAFLGSARRFGRVPLVRLCLVGPPIGIALFLFLSPYPEIRFIYPSLLLLFACGGLALLPLRQPALRFALAGLVAVAGVGTGFIPVLLQHLLPRTIIAAAALALLGWGASQVGPRHWRGVVALGGVLAVAFLGCVVYMYFSAFVHNPLSGYAVGVIPAWRPHYGEIVDAWAYVRDETPAGSTIAYTNTCFTYPLYGFDLSRRVVYAPTRGGIRHLRQIPPATARLAGEQIIPYVAAELTEWPEREHWLANLQHKGVQYLFVAKPSVGPAKQVPELDLAGQDPQRFEQLFENAAAVVYRVRLSG